MASSKRKQVKNTSSKSEFIQVIEQYVQKAAWTNQELMNDIKVGETQFYRWARGDSVPRKVIVNRVAVSLAKRLDQIEQNLPHDPFPGSDRIDGILNELLEAAGYCASIKGRGIDSSWHEIAKKQTWILGYTSTIWSQVPNRPSSSPTGLAIEFAERIGRLLGIGTEWKYLTWDEMPLAVREREVDGIAPFLLVLPERFFDFRFSAQCSKARFKLAALSIPDQSKDANFLEDLSPKSVQLVYVEKEIGEWGANFLGSPYQHEKFQENEQAISYFMTTARRNSNIIPVFLSDEITCQELAKQKSLRVLNVKSVAVETYSAFAFHPDERQLIAAVNSAISLVEPIFT